MKLKSLVQTSALSIVVAGLLVGCGSSGGSSTPDVQTGTFVDAPVKGLHYTTATKDGYTDENGTFSYLAGEEVEFKLGNLSLGKVTGGTLITPYTLAGDTNISNPSDKATNIAMLLQSFDGNRTNTDMLDVSKLQDANLSDINISVSTSDMTTKIANKFADNSFTQYRDSSNNSPVNATIAKTTMNTYVTKVMRAFTAKYLTGKTLYFVMDSCCGEEKPAKAKLVFGATSYTITIYTENDEMTKTTNYSLVDGKIRFLEDPDEEAENDTDNDDNTPNYFEATSDFGTSFFVKRTNEKTSEVIVMKAFLSDSDAEAYLRTRPNY